MNAVDGSHHYEQGSNEQIPSLLVIILDTNPAAWSLLSSALSLSQAIGNLLVFINAHLACSYTNQVAVVASHCDAAQYLYPTSFGQHTTTPNQGKRGVGSSQLTPDEQSSESTKRLKVHGSNQEASHGSSSTSAVNGNTNDGVSGAPSGKYPLFRKVEEELLRNLSTLLQSTDTATVSSTASTKLAGALTLALCYINRQNVAVAEASGGPAHAGDTLGGNTSLHTGDVRKSALHSRILLVSVSQSHDLAQQYIPIMNSIFACQRLSIPIDICKIPLLNAPSNSTVFLQQASDATRGIYIPLNSPTPGGFLQFLLMAFLPTQSSRLHLVLPTRIDVDFRAACFCHRRVVDLGFVCSICLSIFCSVPENGDCLTCGTHLELGNYGGRPMVVPRRKKKRDRTNLDTSRVSIPTPGPP